MSWPLQVYLVTLALILKVRVLIHSQGLAGESDVCT